MFIFKKIRPWHHKQKHHLCGVTIQKRFFCQSIKKNIRKSYVRKQRKQRSKMSFIALQYVILFFIKTLSLFPNPHHKLSSLCHYGNM